MSNRPSRRALAFVVGFALSAASACGPAVAAAAADAATQTIGTVNGTPTATACGSAKKCTAVAAALGSPEASACASTEKCTYVQEHLGNGRGPTDVSPVTGTIVSWHLASNSTGGPVALRVLRPSPSPQVYTAVATSVPETAVVGVNDFTTSLPIQAGDAVGLDDASGGIYFAKGSAENLLGYWPSPGLVEGATASVSEWQARLVLQLSVNIVPGSSSGGGGPGGGGSAGGTGGTGGSSAGTKSPLLSGFSLTHRRFLVSSRTTRGRSVARGTTFHYSLNEAATVRISIARVLTGHRVGSRCRTAVARGRSSGKLCRIVNTLTTLTSNAHAGANSRQFSGHYGRRTLAAGNYLASAVARVPNTPPSQARTVTFTVVP